MPTTQSQVCRDLVADSGVVAPVTAVYSDGGTIGRSPSPDGGTWAFALVGERKVLNPWAAHEFSVESDVILWQAGGYVTPAELGREDVSSNAAESLAMLLALECLPDGWAGPVYCDSLMAIRVTQKRLNVKWMPAAYVARVRAVRERLGRLDFVLLGGHPSKAALAAGARKDGKPVSRHNVHCDRLCRAAAEGFLARVHQPRGKSCPS